MATYEIKNLQDLLAPVLGKSDFICASIKKLTTAGENYCSLILAVDVTVKNGESQKEIRTVAKMLPQSSFIQEMFKSATTFRNEVGYYDTISPCLRHFQKEQGFTCLLSSAPDFYSARNGLDLSSDAVTDDAVLLIQNLKDEGFGIVDRKVGFNLDQSRMILEKMAELHATALALKSLKPKVFEEKLGQYFGEYRMFEGSKEQADKMFEIFISLVEDDEFCVENSWKMRETLEANVRNGFKRNNKDLQRSPFVSLVHNDMWSNNIMVKIVDQKTVDVKFVDYQVYDYSLLTRDVIFFLFSSIQINVVKENCDDLLEYYYEHFIKYLKALKCDVSVFKFDDFLNEIAAAVRLTEFVHLLVMVKPIHALEEDAKELESMQRDDFISGKVANAAKEKACFIVREFIRRGWI